MIRAEEARELVFKSKNANQITDIEQIIKRECQKENLKVVIPYAVTKDVKKFLEENGYKVEWGKKESKTVWDESIEITEISWE